MRMTTKKALHAAKHKHIWGRWSTFCYVVKNKVPLSVYRLACQLQAVERADSKQVLTMAQL